MAELRFDPIKRHWVIVARRRSQRPSEFQLKIQTRDRAECPFCPSHETMTPEAILTLPTDDRQRGFPWEARLIPNKFPAVRLDAEMPDSTPELHDQRPAYGRHEVMIESANHEDRQARYSTSHFTRLLTIYQSRIRKFTDDRKCRYAALFTNVGYRGGATLAHPHSQIIGLPQVPAVIGRELDSSVNHWRASQSCLFCKLVETEMKSRSRLVMESADYVVLAPYASRFAYEFAVYPKRHSADFTKAVDTELPGLAEVLIHSLGNMDNALKKPDYNLVLHSAPSEMEGITPDVINRAYHWHFEVIPRVSTQAGMEWGMGVHINSIPPEKAARVLASGEVES